MNLTVKALHLSFYICLLLAPLSSRAQSPYTLREDRQPVLALKTNLLFDLATAVNVEIEVPIGKRVSIAAEHIFPNWGGGGFWPGNDFCLQACVSSLEPRIWLGKRDGRRVLTGHFLGVYGQYGDFDFQPFTDHGWRVYNGWAAGLSYGFAHAINKAGTLSLEYSIGLGYAWADYCTYNIVEGSDRPVSKEEWHYNTSIFPVPTKAKISLVWLITSKKKEAGK